MRVVRVLVLSVAAALSSIAAASGVDAVYYPDQGKLILPNLKVGNQVYYAILKQLPGTYDFRLDATTLNSLSGQLSYTPAPLSDLVGNTFSTVDSPTSWATFNADGTYTQYQGPKTDANCPAAGGYETGTWQYEPSTGVFSAIALTDGNGQCGFSHPQGAYRIKKIGTDLYFTEGNSPNEKLVKK